MSGKNNVNPGHYKVAGRERQGEAIVHEREKQRAGLDATARRRGPGNFIPGAAPAGEAAPRGEPVRRATATQRKQTLKNLPKKTRIALGKEGAKAKRRAAA